ncbi:MAG: aspartate/glutamate racemase family protein [Desulfovibrio sp.]|nr:aspartate/glutamate racemase family protein [Desulfovibrio sp.]
MKLQGGKLYYDVPVGILCLDSPFPKPRGHLRNPRTFAFPTVMKVLSGLSVPGLLFGTDPGLEKTFVAAALELEAEGVKAITGSCGFMARFQKAVAAACRVPVLLSSLAQLPLVRLAHGPSARIGVLTASAQALGPGHFTGGAEEMATVAIRGMENCPEFRETILEGARQDMDLERLEGEVVGTAEAFAAAEKLDALVLECTDLTAFAGPVQARVGIPVYDIIGLVEYLCHAVERGA